MKSSVILRTENGERLFYGKSQKNTHIRKEADHMLTLQRNLSFT